MIILQVEKFVCFIFEINLYRSKSTELSIINSYKELIKIFKPWSKFIEHVISERGLDKEKVMVRVGRDHTI